MIFLSLCLAALAMPPALAMQKPYRVSLIGDGFDGTSWSTGVRIELEPGWKTYWRMPGEAGIPPEFTWSSTAPADISVAYPVPRRYEDASGETIGYSKEVVLPVTVTAKGATELDLGLKLFFAVCKDICIPADAEASITLGASVRDPAGSARVEEARGAVPKPGGAVSGVLIEMVDGKPVLKLSLGEAVDDIFVETSGTAYFRAPVFSADGREAALVVDNVTDAGALRGLEATFTYTRSGQGFEQRMTLR